MAWLFRTGQFRASSEAKLNVRDQIYKQVVKLGPGLLGKRRTGEIANTATEGVEYLDYYFSVYFVQIWVAIATPLLLVAAIFWIDWVVGLFMLAGVPATPLFVGSSARGFRRISAKNEVVKNRNSAQYLDSIQGMSTLKMFNQAIRRGQQIEGGHRRAAPGHDEVIAGCAIAVHSAGTGFRAAGHRDGHGRVPVSFQRRLHDARAKWWRWSC